MFVRVWLSALRRAEKREIKAWSVPGDGDTSLIISINRKCPHQRGWEDPHRAEGPSRNTPIACEEVIGNVSDVRQGMAVRFYCEIWRRKVSKSEILFLIPLPDNNIRIIIMVLNNRNKEECNGTKT